MATPLLIDTDMGVDDALAIALALQSPEVHVAGLVTVGGNVALAQATRNLARLLPVLHADPALPIARGLDNEDPQLRRADYIFGGDGFGGIELPEPPAREPADYAALYEQSVQKYGQQLVIVAIGPLTNLAALLRERPGLLQGAGRIIVMGGAVWCPGNVTQFAEFNFYRDPAAAAAVLSAGLPVTVVPLDVTRQVALDESHLAHLARSAAAGADVLARMVRSVMGAVPASESGRFLVHDAVAVGVPLWPELFLHTKMGLDVVTSGTQAGRTRPLVARQKERTVAVIISVNVTDFLENLLERLCRERFVV